MARLFLISLITLTATMGSPCEASETTQKGTVVVLHGLLRTSQSMATMADALADHGYFIVNLDYPSTEISIEETSDLLDQALLDCCAESDEPVHFVTHSLGGIIVRFYLDDRAPRILGRVVMLSPPNSGSEVVDALDDFSLFRTGLGPAAQELSTKEDSVPVRLGPVTFELGVITGNKSINPLFSWLIPGEDDGQVSVEGARIAGMTDFLVLPHTHTFIMNSPEVIRQTLRFLEHGSFDQESP